MNNLELNLPFVMAVLLGAGIPLMTLILWFKRRRLRSRPEIHVDSANEPIQGSDQDRLLAEAQLKGSTMDLRRDLLEAHELYDRYFTLHGFSQQYMNDFVNELRAAGIDCETVFQETMPMGVGLAVNERQGQFELYIRREQMADADRLIRARLQKN